METFLVDSFGPYIKAQIYFTVSDPLVRIVSRCLLGSTQLIRNSVWYFPLFPVTVLLMQ
jgi:hypothetical protein